MEIKDLFKQVQLMNFDLYDENISYCGLWAGNKYRSRLGIQKILPFNKFCFLHDKGYYLIFQNFKTLSFLEIMKLKRFIDKTFFENMKRQASEENKNSKIFWAYVFYNVVTIMTPIYYLGWKFST
jgi:hypothetical protein